MVHNTGGGQTKCLRLGRSIRYVKDNLPEPDPIFRLIQGEAKVGWREMYQDFNMGIGFEFIVDSGGGRGCFSGFGEVWVGGPSHRTMRERWCEEQFSHRVQVWEVPLRLIRCLWVPHAFLKYFFMGSQ